MNDRIRVFNFEAMIDLLKEKVLDKMSSLREKRENVDKRLKRNVAATSFLDKVSGIMPAVIFSVIIAVILTFGVGGIGLLVKSYNTIASSLSIITDVEKVVSAIWFLLGISSVVAGGALGYNALKLKYELVDIFEDKILSPLGYKLAKKREKFNQKIMGYNHHIEAIQNIFESLNKADECYRYMIHSSLMHKTFSKSDVALLFKLLMKGYDINSLIYLLYHDRLLEFNRMSHLERKKLLEIINIDKNIAQVREYSMHLEQLRQQQTEQSSTYQRKRRVTTFHTHPYDDRIAEYDAQLRNDINNNSSGKRR